MTGNFPDSTSNFADSIADHSYANHGHEFRNETPDGGRRTSKKSYGERIEVHSREDLAKHVKDTLADPGTKYFVDEAKGGRTVFFNEKTGTVIILNPEQLTQGDGHAGSVFRDRAKELGRTFNKEFNETTKRMGKAPEIKSAADGKWAEQLECYKSPIERSAAHARQNPPLEPRGKLPLAIIAENVSDISRLAKAGRLGANMTGVGVVIGAGSILLTRESHAAQRDYAEALKNQGVLSEDAYQAYIGLNESTENILYNDLAVSTADPTGLSIVLTEFAEYKAGSDFKDWADHYAPHLTEAQFQTLSMSMFPGNSARTNMLWQARSRLADTTEGQPEQLHEAINLNALYQAASGLGYSHKEGFVYGGDLHQTLAQAKAMGIEVQANAMNPSVTIQNLQQAVKQKLVDKMDNVFSDPENIDCMLDTLSIQARLDYVRRLAASEDSAATFAQNHPEIAAYVSAYDKSLTGWGWTMKEDDPLRANPDLLNTYIKARTVLNHGKDTAPERPTQDFSVAGSTYAGSIPVEDVAAAGVSVAPELMPAAAQAPVPLAHRPAQMTPDHFMP